MKHPGLYYTVLILHSMLTIWMSLGWLSNNNIVLWTLFFTLILGLFLFIINRGCFITRIEYRLGGKGYTIMDPVLNRLGIHTSRTSRTNATMILFLFSLMITCYKLFIH